ncbi:MAG: (2Fe-2S)-binding protein [Syntrophorhabdales bacterium]|jgi:aerobic-type carbon monoxide dehydrogenase small subunit (CoxS/CutS family)
MIRPVEFTLNRKRVRLETDDERMLLWVLRSDLALTGTKYGCGEALCGACTVVVNGKAVRSCQTPLKEVSGKEVLTIEGLERNGKLHPLQKAFVDHDALQCGFCTPGMIMNAYALLIEQPAPPEAAIIRGMEDNLCRCASHVRIVKAVQTAAKEMKGGRR